MKREPTLYTEEVCRVGFLLIIVIYTIFFGNFQIDGILNGGEKYTIM